MLKLSPAAQAVLDAFHKELSPDNQPGGLPAALRAIEDQLAQDRADPLPPDLERAVLNERIRLFRRITAIAAELDAQS
jgi:hypothetical protein